MKPEATISSRSLRIDLNCGRLCESISQQAKSDNKVSLDFLRWRNLVIKTGSLLPVFFLPKISTQLTFHKISPGFGAGFWNWKRQRVDGNAVGDRQRIEAFVRNFSGQQLPQQHAVRPDIGSSKNNFQSISVSEIPQLSTHFEYVPALMTSGGIQAYVPAADIRVVLYASRAKPKSVIFRVFPRKSPSSIDSLISTFELFKSR